MSFAALLVSGCAGLDGSAGPIGGGRLAVDAADGTRKEYRLESDNGDSIALSGWLPDASPSAVIVAVHGFGDYGPSTFAGAAEHWARAGIATYAYDQRGFGRNPSNGNWPGHDALVEDLSTVSRLVRSRHPQTPVILMGHSMGGAVVVAALGEGRVEADKTILLAPALWGGPNLNVFLRSLAFGAAAILPDKRWTGDGIVRIQASDNIEMLRSLGRDPLYVSPPSSREFVGLIRLMDRAYNAAENVRTPVLVVYGAKDQVVPEDPVRKGFDRMPAKKRFEKIDSGWHMLLRDLESRVVWDLIESAILNSAA